MNSFRSLAISFHYQVLGKKDLKVLIVKTAKCWFSCQTGIVFSEAFKMIVFALKRYFSVGEFLNRCQLKILLRTENV